MGNNIQILIFAGTTEGRLLAQYASQHEIGCYVSTATEYGKSILEGLKGVECISGRMDRKEMEIFIGEHEIRLVIDATHPFAVEVSENIKAACEKEAKAKGELYIKLGLLAGLAFVILII